MNPPEPRISSPPWETPGVDDEARVIAYRDRCGKKRTLAHVYGSSSDERDANARLIALAPRMAAVLREIDATFRVSDPGRWQTAASEARAIVRELGGGIVP